MEYALIILTLLAALAITFTPLLRRRRIWFVGDVESEFAHIVRQREDSLRALKDLEEERLSRKLSQDDFDRLRPMYLERAKDLTLKLDAAQEKLAQARKRIEQQLADGIPTHRD